MKRSTLVALNEARRAGRAVVRAVECSSGDDLLMELSGDDSPLGSAAAAAMQADRSIRLEIAGKTWLFTVYNPPLDLVIVGAVHIAQPLSIIAQLAGYRVRIVDPRTVFATQERFPGMEITHDWPDEALAKQPLGPRSALVALTHDPKVDDPALIAALHSAPFYIGALGSKKTHAARLQRLKQHGLTDDLLGRIHGPIGLSIGARSPAEIAISILAEMTKELRTGSVPEQAATHAAIREI